MGASYYKLDIENRKAVGVSYWKNNQLIKVKSKKEVILSAGSINTPQILELSGIGQRSVIENNSINLVHELKGVGENLRDLPYFFVTASYINFFYFFIAFAAFYFGLRIKWNIIF